ncbi:MAG TPA: phosphoribosylformylglycinamidine cyclo-ligase [bacterium]|nr:phosphoribosylformylglycinamidine cyclo-ligase [bacterium]HOL48969.1 phosphoribosylformylglycinamidine cyclo-ligase [bacterium]HPO51353.1 phosphoribosylformylglycinamidine cyclo-ligase [bacterium]
MITYKKSGVNDQKAEMFVSLIKERVKQASFSRKMSGDIGFFGAFIPVSTGNKKSFLVSSCDGVGTKILVANAFEKYDTIGIDLVAMNCNDVAVCGAKPLLFLDYIAVGKLKIEREQKIIEGIIKGCEIAQCVLAGGETAQMPDVYSEDDFDLAGFCAGMVEADKILGPLRVKNDDVLLGITSNGLHSNGFSLVRKVLLSGRGMKRMLAAYQISLGRSMGEELLRPTYIYSTVLSALAENRLIHAAAHITGGGIPGNLVRILPEHLDAEVYLNSWQIPQIFHMIQSAGKVMQKEMFNVFNMGIGLILALPERNVDRVKSIVQKHGFRSFLIGCICPGKGRVRLLKKSAG